jgi:hypothetical protein
MDFMSYRRKLTEIANLPAREEEAVDLSIIGEFFSGGEELNLNFNTPPGSMNINVTTTPSMALLLQF